MELKSLHLLEWISFKIRLFSHRTKDLSEQICVRHIDSFFKKKIKNKTKPRKYYLKIDICHLNGCTYNMNRETIYIFYTLGI